MTQALVLDDSRLVHPLLFIEYTVGKRMTLPSHFERPIGKIVHFHVLAGQLLRQLASVQDDLPAAIVEGKLRTDVALFAVAQYVIEPAGRDAQLTVEVLSARSGDGEALVKSIQKVRQQSVAGFHVAGAGEPQFLY